MDSTKPLLRVSEVAETLNIDAPRRMSSSQRDSCQLSGLAVQFVCAPKP